MFQSIYTFPQNDLKNDFVFMKQKIFQFLLALKFWRHSKVKISQHLVFLLKAVLKFEHAIFLKH